MTSLDELQVSEWATSDLPGSNRGGKIESDKLELILRSINSLRGVLGAYTHLLVPALLKLSDSLASLSSSVHMGLTESALLDLQVQSLRTISALLCQSSSSRTASSSVFWGEGCQHSTESGLSARSVQPLVRLLRTEPPVCRDVGIALIETLCVCARQIGGTRWQASYHDVVESTIISWQSASAESLVCVTNAGTEVQVTLLEDRRNTGLGIYNEVLREFYMTPLDRKNASSYFHDGFGLSQRKASLFASEARQLSFLENTPITGTFDSTGADDQTTSTPFLPVWNQAIRQKVNQGNLQRAWDVTQRASRDDWDEWMRRLAIQLLREAPSPALRATANLAHAYQVRKHSTAKPNCIF